MINNIIIHRYYRSSKTSKRTPGLLAPEFGSRGKDPEVEIGQRKVEIFNEID
jgi:hypothetical protein